MTTRQFLPHMMMIAGVVLIACVPTQSPVDASDGSIDASDFGDADATTAVATCVMWCKHATDLKCTAAAPTKGGAPCTDVCNNVQSGPAKMNLKCRAAAKTCAAADICEN